VFKISTRARAPSLVSFRVAAMPSITGIRMSIDTTSGFSSHQLNRLAAIAGLTVIVDPAAAEHQLRPATDQLGDRNSR
jgi:hypothetical protein